MSEESDENVDDDLVGAELLGQPMHRIGLIGIVLGNIATMHTT